MDVEPRKRTRSGPVQAKAVKVNNGKGKGTLQVEVEDEEYSSQVCIIRSDRIPTVGIGRSRVNRTRKRWGILTLIRASGVGTLGASWMASIALHWPLKNIIYFLKRDGIIDGTRPKKPPEQNLFPGSERFLFLSRPSSRPHYDPPASGF